MSDADVPHCQRCGAAAGEESPYESRRPILVAVDWEPLDELGLHRHPRQVCSLCSEGARNQAIEAPSAHELLIQVWRASASDQFKVLNWLRDKFPDH